MNSDAASEEAFTEMRDAAIRRAGTKAVEKLLTYGLELGIVSERDGRAWLRNIVEKLQAYLDTADATEAATKNELTR